MGGGATNGPTHPVFVLSGDPRADHARLRPRRSGPAAPTSTSSERPTPRCCRSSDSQCCRCCRSMSTTTWLPISSHAAPGGHRRPCPHCRAAARGRRAHDAALRLAGPAAARDANGRLQRPIYRRRPVSSSSCGRSSVWRPSASTPRRTTTISSGLGSASHRHAGTSLLVLETLDQYLQHDVTPPSTSPELRAAFLQRRDQERVSKTARLQDKTARVVSMWENRVAWWSREFDYARNFRFEAPKSANRDRLWTARRGAAERGGPPPAPAVRRRRSRRVASPAAAGARARALTSDLSVSVTAPSPTINTATAEVARRDEPDAAASRIAIKAWNPDTPYLRSLRGAGSERTAGIWPSVIPTARVRPSIWIVPTT